MTKGLPQTRHAEVGDEIFFHLNDAPCCGKVLSAGKHGVTVAHQGRHRQIGWDRVLGHKRRISQKLKIVHEGEDGMIVEDQSGKKRFMHVPPEAIEDQGMVKSENNRRLLLFTKSEKIANRAGLHLENRTDRTGRNQKKWVRSNADKTKVNKRPKADDPDPQDKRGSAAGYGIHNIEAGDRIQFKLGELAGEGEVVGKPGKDGAHVRDSSGHIHQVRWDQVIGLKASPDTKKPEHKRPVLGKQEPIHPDNFTASEYAKSHDKADITPKEILSNFPDDTADKIAEVQARLKSIEQTIDLHKNDDGQYTDERRQLHDSILCKLFSVEKIKAATPPEGEKPTFVILGGRGGCLSADHEFLSRNGWKRIDQYQASDEVLVFDLALNVTRFEQPQGYINLPCNKFYHFKSRGVDMVLSEEHKVLFNKKFNPKVWRTSSVVDIVAEHGRLVEGWDGMIPCTFPAPKNVEGVALSDDELRLMVAVCADGSFALDTTSHCRMALRKDRKKERLVDLLNKCGIKYTETAYDGRPTESRYGFYAPQNNKTLSAYWKATASQLAIIADEILYWDGWVDQYGSWIYTSTNCADIDFVSYLFSSQGRRSSFYCDERENTGWKPIWRISGAKNGGFAGIRYGQNKSQIKIVPSPDGRKYCFTVSTGFFITRCKDSICITGNSGKSWFAENVYDSNKFIVLDADHIKGLLPEYEGWNAHQVHEESGEIFDRAVEFARSYGLNIVLDKTMKTAKSAIADVRAFKEAGYRTEAHYMHLPRQEAAKRAVARFLGKTKRFVPPEVVLSNTTNEHSFDQVKHLVDDWSFRDNNVLQGQYPILISMKKAVAKLTKAIRGRIIILWRWKNGKSQ